MNIRQLLLLPFIICSLTASAQHDSAKGSISNYKFIKINYENDFFTGTDMYYTQGIKLDIVFPWLRYSPIMFLLPKLSNSVVEYGINGVQDCFTPQSITSPTILYGDEPFAGYFYLGHYKVSYDNKKKQVLTAEVDVGEIGPCASCEQEQKAIHAAVPGNVQPDGWEYQIGLGLMLNYKLRYEKSLFSDTAINFDAVGQINVGTVYDNARAGFALHVGKMQSFFIGNHNSGFQLYGNFQAWVEGVAYNGTYQGALFTHDNVYTLPYKQINSIVLGDSYGICFSHRGLTVEYYATRITNQIKTGLNHGWGHLGIAVNF
ncbi:MAG TPA: lipid A-modifier LpxR family protein [Bacteroidia bacterium]|jgi:lipid A 3-O-deacylase|nr:lipid A-modifier LpxR family protein [Bacteroidia bacterium]